VCVCVCASVCECVCVCVCIWCINLYKIKESLLSLCKYLEFNLKIQWQQSSDARQVYQGLVCQHCANAACASSAMLACMLRNRWLAMV